MSTNQSTYSVLLDPRFSSQSRENQAPQGINVERSQREIRPGPGTDAVQEETGELGYYPIIDIIFHEDTVLNLRCLLRTGRIEGVKIGQVWVSSTALVGGHKWVLGASHLHVTS